jgi:hypothetical protein
MTWRILRRVVLQRWARRRRSSFRAEAQAKALGTDPALVFIPHPVQDRTDDELRALADEYFGAILKLLVK